MIDVVAIQVRHELVEDRVHDRRGHHQADGARLRELVHEILERRRAGRALLGEAGDGVRRDVLDDARVSAAHQTPHHVRAHPSESDHSELHAAPLLIQRSRPISPRVQH